MHQQASSVNLIPWDHVSLHYLNRFWSFVICIPLDMYVTLFASLQKDPSIGTVEMPNALLYVRAHTRRHILTYVSYAKVTMFCLHC